jgi:hypothetical protein
MVGGSGHGELARLLSVVVVFLFLIEDRFERVVAEVAAADEPLVVLLDHDAGREPNQRAVVGEDADADSSGLAQPLERGADELAGLLARVGTEERPQQRGQHRLLLAAGVAERLAQDVEVVRGFLCIGRPGRRPVMGDREIPDELIERAAGVELEQHLGYRPGAEAPERQPNRRNGTSSKTHAGRAGYGRAVARP